MKYNVVLPDEMDQACLFIFPVLFPVRGQLLGSRNITNGCVKPYIEHLSVGTFNGYGNPPVQIATYCTGMQSLVEPRFALSVYIGLPLLVLLQDPLLEPGLVLVQGKVPVFGLLQNRLTSADGRNRVYQIGGAQ